MTNQTPDQVSDLIVSRLRETGKDDWSQDYCEEIAAIDIMEGLGRNATDQAIDEIMRLVRIRFGHDLSDPFEVFQERPRNE